MRGNDRRTDSKLSQGIGAGLLGLLGMIGRCVDDVARIGCNSVDDVGRMSISTSDDLARTFSNSSDDIVHVSDYLPLKHGVANSFEPSIASAPESPDRFEAALHLTKDVVEGTIRLTELADRDKKQ